jgi:hypothetical protein
MPSKFQTPDEFLDTLLMRFAAQIGGLDAL